MPWIDCHESRSRNLKCLRIVHPATVPPLRILEVHPPPKKNQLRILAYKNHMLPTKTLKKTWIILDPTINRFSIIFLGKDAPIHLFFCLIVGNGPPWAPVDWPKNRSVKWSSFHHFDLEVDGNHGFDRLFAIISSRETQDFLKQTSWSIHTAQLVRITVWNYALNRFTRWFW